MRLSQIAIFSRDPRIEKGVRRLWLASSVIWLIYWTYEAAKYAGGLSRISRYEESENLFFIGLVGPLLFVLIWKAGRWVIEGFAQSGTRTSSRFSKEEVPNEASKNRHHHGGGKLLATSQSIRESMNEFLISHTKKHLRSLNSPKLDIEKYQNSNFLSENLDEAISFNARRASSIYTIALAFREAGAIDSRSDSSLEIKKVVDFFLKEEILSTLTEKLDESHPTGRNSIHLIYKSDVDRAKKIADESLRSRQSEAVSLIIAAIPMLIDNGLPVKQGDKQFQAELINLSIAHREDMASMLRTLARKS